MVSVRGNARWMRRVVVVQSFRHHCAVLESGADAEVAAALRFLADAVDTCQKQVDSVGEAALSTPSFLDAVLTVIPRLVGSAWICKFQPDCQPTAHIVFCRVLSLAVSLFPWIDRFPPIYACVHLLLGT